MSVHGYRFADPILGLCTNLKPIVELRDHGDHYRWVREGDNICLEPKTENSDKSRDTPDGLCLAAKVLADGAPLKLAKDVTGNPPLAGYYPGHPINWDL